MLSFLNPFVIPASYLASSEGRCFNVHPATPDFPGRDPQHWAFYEGATEAGATLHRMDESVDSGEIVDVMTAPSPRSDGVMRHIERSEVLATQLLLRHLPALLADGVKPTADRQWRTQARRTRADFLRMCRLSPDLPADEIRRRIDAFYNPAHRSIHIDLHGYRFVYEPVDGRTDV